MGKNSKTTSKSTGRGGSLAPKTTSGRGRYGCGGKVKK